MTDTTIRACMYDSKYTDYKITSEECPFHTNENADIVGSLYDAFRDEGLGISVYFSKPDWHTPERTVRFTLLSSTIVDIKASEGWSCSLNRKSKKSPCCEPVKKFRLFKRNKQLLFIQVIFRFTT